MSPVEIHALRHKELNSLLDQLIRKGTRLSWARLLSFLSAIVVSWLLWSAGWIPALGSFVFFISIFIYFVARDLINKEALENTRFLIRIQENELSALQHLFTHFPDGIEWKPANHDYANDLDIFGRASLFQYINRTCSEQAGQTLAKWLLAPSEKETILHRQTSVKELAGQKNWFQQLHAFGLRKKITILTENKITDWLKEDVQFINKTFWKITRFLFPLVSCLVLVFHITGHIPKNIFYPLLLSFFLLSTMISKKIMPAWIRLNRIAAELATLSVSIAWIEKVNFNSPALKNIQSKFLINNRNASQTIRDLQKILDRLDYRLNPIVFIPLSIFACWDLQQIFALEKWRIKNEQNVSDWFSSLAEMEALSSIANLHFNHPEWVFPTFVDNEGEFTITSMGHPMIPPGKRVDHTFSTTGTGKINLVTGSNMAGKSTFLRSTGVNLILAMMGAPVCAKILTLSPMRVMSTMRISDNLEESTSTFYAELKKLKDIIEAVNRKEKLFLLLDEILRGTNSGDRHTGSKALIKQLIKQEAVGMIATHDLELAKMVTEYPSNILNYHFDVQVSDGELFFDYELKEGVCQSMNASILMKKIGIDI